MIDISFFYYFQVCRDKPIVRQSLDHGNSNACEIIYNSSKKFKILSEDDLNILFRANIPKAIIDDMLFNSDIVRLALRRNIEDTGLPFLKLEDGIAATLAMMEERIKQRSTSTTGVLQKNLSKFEHKESREIRPPTSSTCSTLFQPNPSPPSPCRRGAENNSHGNVVGPETPEPMDIDPHHDREGDEENPSKCEESKKYSRFSFFLFLATNSFIIICLILLVLI